MANSHCDVYRVIGRKFTCHGKSTATGSLTETAEFMSMPEKAQIVFLVGMISGMAQLGPLS